MSEPSGPPKGLGGHQEDTMTLAGLSRDTGIPEQTLRMWQTRYGVPEPVDVGDPSRYRTGQAQLLNRIRERLDAGVVEADAMSQVCGPRTKG